MSQRYVVCLKHGTKYDAEYVNVLRKMTQLVQLLLLHFYIILNLKNR